MTKQDIKTREEVRATLELFQVGYTRRDVKKLDQIMNLFAEEATLEVIGTGATLTGQGEWCMGPEMARELVESDWQHWGDLRLDVAGARVHTHGDVAWLATEGTVAETIPPEQAYEDYLTYVRRLVSEEVDAAATLFEILRGGTSTISEANRGSTYVWPLRFTAVLVKEPDGQWRFRQMQFSFPTTRFPDVRQTEETGDMKPMLDD